MLLLLVLFTTAVKPAVNPQGPTIVNYYAECINNLIEQNFESPGILVFANTNAPTTIVWQLRQNIITKIHHSLQFIIKILIPDNINNICKDNSLDIDVLMPVDVYKGEPTAHYYVIIVDCYKDFTSVASNIVRSRYWNPLAKFIIFINLFYKTKQENEKHVENILTCLFKHNVINIIVLVPEYGNIRNIIIYSWKPYDPPKYCGYYNETAHNRLVVENKCQNGMMKVQTSLFQNIMPENMQKCTLHVLALERNPFISRRKDGPNIEKDLVKSLLRRFNFSSQYTYIDSFRGERVSAGNWSGALKEIISKKSQILLGGIFPDFDVHEDFECSLQYLTDSYTWVVPRANPSPPWIAPAIVFQTLVWYVAITGFLLCVVSWKILGNLSGDSLYNKSLGHCLLNAWISTLGFSAYTRPVTKSLRIFFVFFNLYCIIFLTAYQTKLIVVLQTPMFDQQIDTIEKLVLSGMKFGGFEELHDLFLNSSDSFDDLIGKKWIDVNNMTKAMIDVTVHRNFSVLCSRLELAYVSAIMPELNDAFGKYTYFALETDIFSVPMEMISLKGFPFMKKFSQTLKLYKELGINSYVRRRFQFYNKRQRTKLLVSLHEHQDRFNALSLENLQGAFFCLGVGVLTGCSVLILEILYHFLRK